METDRGTHASNGVEWVGTDVCDGVHPETEERCVLADHKGFHQAGDGSRWLDD